MSAAATATRRGAKAVRSTAPAQAAPSAPQPEAGQASAEQSAINAEPWRVLIRQFLTKTHEALETAALPSEGRVPEGLLSELAIYSVESLAALLNASDTSSQWKDCFATLDELQWARHSMLAVVALLGTEHDGTGAAGNTFRAVSQQLVIACEALKRGRDIAAMTSALQTAAAKPCLRTPPARPRDWLGDILAKVGEAALVLRTLAEDAGTDQIWGLVRLADWLADQVQARLDGEQTSGTPIEDCAADIACVLSIALLVAEHGDQVLIHAAASILELAASFCESAVEAGHA